MTVGLISLLILVFMLIATSVFMLMQIRMLWKELDNKRMDNKETKEIVDIHTKWLNSIRDELRDLREYRKIIRRLP